MDIRQALLKEHSKQQTMKIVQFIGQDSNRFKELMTLFLNDEYRVVQRAAWAVGYCGEMYPGLIYPYLGKMIDRLEQKNVHDAVKRNILRLLQYVEIPEKLLGKTYSHCLDLIDDAEQPVAIRAFAMTVAAKIAGKEPELKRELQLIVKKHLPYASAAFHKRSREILAGVT